jgi:prepilin-type N-terminal cleavage/methylation domain-containing protein
MAQDDHLRTTESNSDDELGPTVAADRSRADGSEVERRPGELGFSLNELLIVVAIIGILAVVVIGETFNAIEKARLAACMANMVAVRESVWANCDGGMDFPERGKLWDEIWRGSGPRGYWYELDNDDANKGHGNDLDGFDEQNPGKAPRTDRNIYFVLACTHDHGRLADYVYLEDEGPPQIAMGRDKPIWDKFYRKANR